MAGAFTFSAPIVAGTAGACHFHGPRPAAQAIVLNCALQRRDTLVKAGKLDASWQTLTHEKIEAVNGPKEGEWKVTFHNPGVQDKSKETLYLFFTLPGNFIAANFTGQ
jgi:hypothetical protein